jgi:chemotaxis protein CheD
LADRPVTSVFIGQLAVSGGECALAVHGLGSCVALVLFEPKLGVGGLAHALLPGARPPSEAGNDLPAKYAASALDSLRAGLADLGARSGTVRAALVGGARMFESETDLDLGIGSRNADSMKSLIAGLGIPLVVEATGGHQGRTVVFELPSCKLRIRTLRQGWTETDLKRF